MADHPFSATPLPEGSRIACRVEYLGTRYNGWQVQPHEGVVTVQGELERALDEVAGRPVRVHCAGRTDTGVHGHCQVIHFDSPVARSAKAWVLGVNANLPPDIRVHWAAAVDGAFHARHSALARRYRYVIANTLIRPALLVDRVCWHRRPLDAALMHEAGQVLLGEQDFSAFRAASCQSVSPMRNVQLLEVSRREDLVLIDIQANAFLHHMVRNIAGSLMAVGDGRKTAAWLRDVLATKDRTQAAETAAACGLYFVGVQYPPDSGIPEAPEGSPMPGLFT